MQLRHGRRARLLGTAGVACALGAGRLCGSASAEDRRVLSLVPGSTRKVSQLTGDFDRQRQAPTLSQTDKRFGVFATDLGSSFEHKGRLVFLFGDTWGRPGLLDAVASTPSRDPAQIRLDFARGDGGKWREPIVPGVGNGAFEIPSGGISIGGVMYVVFTADWPRPGNIMGRSFLAASRDDGRTFRVLYELSRSRFINVSLWLDKGWLYIFGSGAYRRSSVCLARVRASQIANRASLKYLGGLDARGKPLWLSDEARSKPLFEHNVVGEFSVAFCKPARRFVMLYNSGEPRGIVMRSARAPWGAWSPGSLAFDPWRDGGYGGFMHISSGFKTDRPDALSDANREAEWGGEYGPYIMARFTVGDRNRCRIFYTMSTWNPYQVVVMQSDLVLQAPARPST